MEELLKSIYQELAAIHSEVYLEYNLRDKVEYPYITYTYNSEYLGIGQEGFYLDIDVWGETNNTLAIEELTHRLKRELHGKTVMTCDNYLQFFFRNSAVIDTQHKNIRRRWIEVYVRVDWRNEHE